MPRDPMPNAIASDATPYALPASYGAGQPPAGEYPPPAAGGAQPSEADLAKGHEKHGLPPENARAIAKQQAARHHKHK